jgi:two-component system CheB/CheR fusion protein
MASGRVKLDGPAVLLRSGSAQALGLALHELVTNAVKYGALAKPDGRLDVGWQLRRTPEGCPCARLEWKESGVPMGDSAGVDRRFGYGRELIERALPYQLGAKTALFFEPDGVRCTIEIEVVAEEKNG